MSLYTPIQQKLIKLLIWLMNLNGEAPLGLNAAKNASYMKVILSGKEIKELKK